MEQLEQEPNAQPSWFARHWMWLVPLLGCGGCLVLPAACGLGIAFTTIGVVKSTEAYQEALDAVRSSHVAIERLGEPIESGLGNFNVNISADGGEATFEGSLPVKGSRKSGRVEVRGRKTGGEWRYERLDLLVDGEELDLLDEQR